MVVVVVVVVVVVGHDPTGLLAAFSGAGAAGTAGWVLADAETGGNVLGVVVVVDVVLGVLGRVPLPLPACVSGLCEPLGGAAGVEEDAYPDDEKLGMGGAEPATGKGFGVVYPLAAMVSGAPVEESGPRATATTIPTMPRADAAPIACCRRRTRAFCRRRMCAFCRCRMFIQAELFTSSVRYVRSGSGIS